MLTRADYLPLVERALARAQRRVAAVHKDAERVDQAPRLLAEAELLKTARPKPYDKEARVMDYAQDPPRERSIALEPGVPFKTQVERRFRQARRLSEAAPQVLKRLAEVEAEVQRLVALREQVTSVADDADLTRLAEAHTGLVRIAAQASRRPEPRVELPYREYLSRTGRPIWVGKSGTANDRLTFKVASPHAAWLHASGYAGAHVVVQKRRGEVLDAGTRQDAALLAAHFSKAPAGDWVEVAVTEVKFVRKFRGAKTGQVQLSRETHERVRNDPEAAKRLLA